MVIERKRDKEEARVEEIPKYKKYTIKEHHLSKSKLYFIKDKNVINPSKIIYQLHGGSYLTPHTNVYFKNALRYLKISNKIQVVSLDYRIAPKYLFPSALEDAIEGWKYLLSNGYKKEDIIIVGDSAGGNLALALCLYLRDQLMSLPKGIILVSPWADMTDSGLSRVYNIQNDPMFGYSKYLKKIMAPEKTYMQKQDFKNKYVSPVFGEYDDFPSMLIQVGSNEVLESDSITIYEKALKKKVDVKLSRYHKMFHGFQFAGGILPEFKIAWYEIKTFVSEQLNLKSKYDEIN
jgi:acetyl esterase/lipase